MEKDIFPEIKAVEPLKLLKSVAHFLGRILTPLPEEAPLMMSEHFHKEDFEK